MAITLYGSPMSRSLRVSWMLEELELDWRYHYVDFKTGAHQAPDYLAVNPAGKVPALRDDDLVIIESSAICLYLAERYGAGRYLPPQGSHASGLHHQWISFIISELEQALWSMGKHRFALPKDWRIAQMLDIAPMEFDRAIKVAEGWIPDDGYLLGEQPMVADILLAHTLNWARSFKQTLPPKATAFCDRVSSRPQLAAAMAREQVGATEAVADPK